MDRKHHLAANQLHAQHVARDEGISPRNGVRRLQRQHGLSGGQKQRIAAAARQKIDCGVGLSSVGLEAQRDLVVGMAHPRLGGRIGRSQSGSERQC